MSAWSDSFNFRRSVPLLMKLPELRGILQYVTRFRDKVFVIAINGEILESENFPNILLDIAVLRSLNIKVVLVHGEAFQVERAAAQRGMSVSNIDGPGVIDAATLQLSIDVGIRLTNEIMEGLTQVISAPHTLTVSSRIRPVSFMGSTTNIRGKSNGSIRIHWSCC